MRDAENALDRFGKHAAIGAMSEYGTRPECHCTNTWSVARDLRDGSRRKSPCRPFAARRLYGPSQNRPFNDRDAMNSLKELLKFVLVIFILIGSFEIWSWWNVKSVRGFCDEVKPGTPVIALSSIAEAHHQNARWLLSSGPDKETGRWTIYLPIKTTFGSGVCTVEHDKTVVLSSRMEGV